MKKKLRLLFIPLVLLPGFAWSAEPYLETPSTGAARFLLLDRPDPGRLITTGEEEEPGEGERGLDAITPAEYSPDSWNSVREQIETGRFNPDRLKPVKEVQISTESPALPPPEVEFKDSGTSLSVTGRKVITLNYTSKRYLTEQVAVVRPRSLSLFEITQQMQVRMQGKVGSKITVNVDYDDTKLDKQDISVVYQGDPNEVVQNVSFGDIDLSLPATEFVSYNKQVFGIRADLQTRHFKLTVIGSRTKGVTKTKQFTGNTQFQSTEIRDIDYLRRKYYDVTFGNRDRLPIKSGTERIYIDQQTQAIADGVTIFDLSAKDLAVQNSTYTGRFQIMNPGIDYVIDYIKGLVTFNRTLNPQDVLIIDFENASGTRLYQSSSASNAADISGYNPVTRPETFVLLKTRSDIFTSTNTEAGYNRELKTYYSLGQTNIVHDDGHGSFILKVKDLNRSEVGSSLNPTQTYPGPISVDFEQGIFNLDNPFAKEDDAATPDPQLYSAAPISKRIISVEYSYRFKTFMLEPNIVTQSDNIRVDGVKVNRNEDYFIDYDSGFITFYYPERIKQDSKIEIIYEVSPFGGIGNQSLVGGRISYDMNKHFSIGSTMLYEGGIKSNTVPNITDLTNSMLVYEGDAQLKGLNLLGLRTTLGGEVAQSRLNPNLNGSALIDNMEGVKQDDSAGLDANLWQISANPLGSLYGPADPNSVTWASQDIKAKEINAAATSDGTQQVLSVNYDFSVSSEVSIVYPLSLTGLDFSQKTALELVVYGDNNNGPQLNIHLGQVNEDADGAGGQNFVCSRGITLNNAPKSEDTNCDGQLAPSEDTGWLYAPTGKGQKFYGAGNGRMDSEDLNKNGRMDTQDFTGGDFGYPVGAWPGSKFRDNTDSTLKDTVDFSGWRTLFTPISIASTDTYRWAAIKHVRISLKQAAGGAVSGVIKFARVAAVGNTWAVKPSATTGALQVLATNNIDDPGYKPIFSVGGEATDVFSKLYGAVTDEESRSLSEQTLAINYSDIASTSTANVYRKFPRPIDVSQHKKFLFLLNNRDKTDDGARFFLQLGDESNYYRAEVPLDFINTWRLITIDQTDLTKDGIPDAWFNGSNYTVYTSSRGSPSLQQIPQITMGITVADNVSHSGQVYVNELHVAEPIVRVGNARKVEGTFEIPGWMNFGGKHRYVDRNFQTPVTAIPNQDNEQQTGYLNITRLAFLPMSFTGGRQIITTPNAANTGANNLVNSLQEGKVVRMDGTASGSFSAGTLPKLGFNYTKSRADYNLLSRRDDTDVYASNLAYTMPFNFFILPNNINVNYSLGRNKVAYDAIKLTTSAAAGLFNTDERTDIFGAHLTFTPWSGSSFNPGYSLQQVREKRFALSSPDTVDNYPKSMQQTAEFNSNLRLLSWVNPGVNYSITTMENNNLNTITVTKLSTSAVFNAGEIKTVNRTAQGGISLTLNMNDIMPRNRLLRSIILSSNYQIQDGDSWQNIEKSLNVKQKLWLRDSLSPDGFFAQRNSITLRDTISSSQRWQPFEGFALRGMFAPLNTISVSNNFSNSVQRSEVTGTITRSINRTFPDLIFSISQLELLTHTSRWAQNETVNLKYSKNTNETKLISLDVANAYGADFRLKLFNYFDTAMSYNTQLTTRQDLRLNVKVQSTRHQDATFQSSFDYMKFRFAPKVDYAFDITRGGLGIITQQTQTITPSLLIKADTQLPKGLRLPFIKRIFAFTNRITWTTTLSYAIKKSPITLTDNNRLFTLNSSADYEAAKNLRLTFNAGIQRFWHKYLKEEEYISYQGGSTLTFQF